MKTLLFAVAAVALSALTGCIHLPVTPAVEGVVVDSETNEPVQGATVRLCQIRNPEWCSEAVTGQDGSFHLSPYKIWTPVPFDPVILIKGDLQISKSGYEDLLVAGVEKMPHYEYRKAVLGNLKLKKKTAEPGATDNPDDAQRLREDP